MNYSNSAVIENKLAETFEKTIKSLQKEGFLKEAKSFDLSFTGKSINIRLNEAVSLQETDITEDDINAIYDIAQKESKKIIKAFNTELLNYGTFSFPKAFSSLRAGSIHYGCGMSDKYCLFAHMYDQGGIMKSSEMDQYISGMQLSGILHSPEIEKIDRGIYKLSSLGRSYVEAVQDILAKHNFVEVVSDTVKSHWFATPKDYDWWQSIKDKVLTV